jgi:hypothetical protein
MFKIILLKQSDIPWIAFIVGYLIAISMFCSSAGGVEVTISQAKLLSAIQQVETPARCASGCDVKGDNGNALGPFQIWKSYWQDAVEYDSSIGGSYDDVIDYGYAVKIVSAYMRRYAPNNLAETWARIHNGGPRGHKKKATIPYWNKVKKILESLN